MNFSCVFILCDTKTASTLPRIHGTPWADNSKSIIAGRINPNVESQLAQIARRLVNVSSISIIEPAKLRFTSCRPPLSLTALSQPSGSPLMTLRFVSIAYAVRSMAATKHKALFTAESSGKEYGQYYIGWTAEWRLKNINNTLTPIWPLTSQGMFLPEVVRTFRVNALSHRNEDVNHLPWHLGK